MSKLSDFMLGQLSNFIPGAPITTFKDDPEACEVKDELAMVIFESLISYLKEKDEIGPNPVDVMSVISTAFTFGFSIGQDWSLSKYLDVKFKDISIDEQLEQIQKLLKPMGDES